MKKYNIDEDTINSLVENPEATLRQINEGYSSLQTRRDFLKKTALATAGVAIL